MVADARLMHEAADAATPSDIPRRKEQQYLPAERVNISSPFSGPWPGLTLSITSEGRAVIWARAVAGWGVGSIAPQQETTHSHIRCLQQS